MRRLLVVDDDTLVRQVFSLALERAGFLVTSVTNGIEALKTVADTDFDAVIMDINMPHVSGIETCRRMVRESSSERRPLVWLMTGLWTREVEIEGFAAGAQGILEKPFTSDYLVGRLESGWAQREARQVM